MSLPRAKVPLRALVVREAVDAIEHPVQLPDGTKTVCRTDRPAGTCTCGTWALDWLPVPARRPTR